MGGHGGSGGRGGLGGRGVGGDRGDGGGRGLEGDATWAVSNEGESEDGGRREVVVERTQACNTGKGSLRRRWRGVVN